MAKLIFDESSDIITIIPETIEEGVNLSKFCEKYNWERDEIGGLMKGPLVPHIWADYNLTKLKDAKNKFKQIVDDYNLIMKRQEDVVKRIAK